MGGWWGVGVARPRGGGRWRACGWPAGRFAPAATAAPTPRRRGGGRTTRGGAARGGRVLGCRKDAAGRPFQQAAPPAHGRRLGKRACQGPAGARGGPCLVFCAGLRGYQSAGMRYGAPNQRAAAWAVPFDRAPPGGGPLAKPRSRGFRGWAVENGNALAWDANRWASRHDCGHTRGRGGGHGRAAAPARAWQRQSAASWRSGLGAAKSQVMRNGVSQPSFRAPARGRSCSGARIGCRKWLVARAAWAGAQVPSPNSKSCGERSGAAPGVPAPPKAPCKSALAC